MLKLNQPIPISGFLQSYHWGKDRNSIVGKLSATESSNGHYAELWYGDHLSGPAVIIDNPSTNLAELINEQPDAILGTALVQQGIKQLPFLFKFLSINQPLSIQVHPEKKIAEKLHIENPSTYRDPNPKPEIGIALNKTTILCGFRDASEIFKLLQPNSTTLPELADMFTGALLNKLEDSLNNTAEFLSLVTTSLLSTDDHTIQQQCQKLYKRINSKSNPNLQETWLLQLSKYFPAGDVGVFFLFILNLIELDVGQAIYIKPGTLHAYLEGEIAECMAASDNVVRAGLTIKAIDKKTLLKITNFSDVDEECYQQISLNSGHVKLCPSDQNYFSLEVFNNYSESVQLANNSTPKLLVCFQGEVEIHYSDKNQILKSGQALLIPSNCNYLAISGSKAQYFLVSCNL